MSDKLMRILRMVFTKSGAWTAFWLLMVSIITFPFVIIPLAFGPPSLWRLYLIFVLGCGTYLSLFIWVWILSKIKNTGFRTAVAVLSITLFVSCGLLIQTTMYKREIRFLEAHWGVCLPSDVKLNYHKYKSYGFVGDHDEFSYYSFTLKSQWQNEHTFLTNRIGPSAHAQYQIHGIGGLEEKFPEQSELVYFRLLFERTMEKYQFDILKGLHPRWDKPTLKWGLTGGHIGDSEAILFIVFTPDIKRLVFFEHIICSH